MEMMDWIYKPDAWLAFLTLTGLEIVLGIDNIIFIAILAGRLPEHQRNRARVIGLFFAMITRILLLLSLFWIMKLTKPLFSIGEFGVSGRDLILILGGLFLLVKSTLEIHRAVDDTTKDEKKEVKANSFNLVIVQIAILDIVFSLDSVITAVGMASQYLMVMILAVIIAVCIMMIASKAISEFIEKHPTLKMLALSFLMLVGVVLIAEGLHLHIPKGYIYFAMAFSLAVESINIYIRSKQTKHN
jgi:predicted tellurium resistance membrane protein TerC